MNKPIKKTVDTSWDEVSDWYGQRVGEKGHYYHQKVILPNIIRQLEVNKTDRILDVGCGQGILGRFIGKDVVYLGLDISAKLIEEAKKGDRSIKHRYLIGDATKPLETPDTFNKVVMILSLQNMKQPFLVIKNVCQKLSDRGQIFLVLNHPCFRIPQNSDWGYDPARKEQFRKVYKYYQPQKLEIKTNPFKGDSQQATWSFHYPLSTYIEIFKEVEMGVIDMEEWGSPKLSVGGRAQAENEARKQIPMFMLLVAQKL